MQICVNYKSREVNWAPDAAYFRTVGITGVRIHLPAINSPWSNPAESEGNLAWLRRMAQWWQDEGFYVTWGIAGLNGFNGDGQLTSTQFDNYKQVILDEAAYLQANGHNFTFEIGNELESKADGTTLTMAQLVAGLGDLATDVQAVYTNGPIAYSPWDYNNTTYDLWISTGKGGLDYINVHPYTNTTTGNRGLEYGGYSVIAKMAKAFPGACDVTECGMEAGNTALQALPQYVKQNKMREMLKMMEHLGFQRIFLYSYVGNLNANDDFAFKLNSGLFDPQWNVVISKGKRMKYNGTSAVTVASLRTAPSSARSTATGRATASATKESRLYFDGNKGIGYIQPLDLSILSIGASSDYSFGMTVNLKKKSDAIQNDGHCIMCFDFDYGSDQGGSFYVGATNGQLSAFFGQTSYTSSTGVIEYEIDQQLTVTLTGTTLKAYVQGTLVWTQTVVRKVTGDNNNSFIGQEGVQFRGFFGNMRQIFAVKSLITQEQVNAIMLGTYPSGLGIHYKCDEGVGPILRDSAGNNNFGQVTLLSGVSSSRNGAVWKNYGRRTFV